jgi:hypothetical protein
MPTSATERTLNGLMEHLLQEAPSSLQETIESAMEAMSPEQRRRGAQMLADIVAQYDSPTGRTSTSQPNPQFLEGERDYNDLSPE